MSYQGESLLSWLRAWYNGSLKELSSRITEAIFCIVSFSIKNTIFHFALNPGSHHNQKQINTVSCHSKMHEISC